MTLGTKIVLIAALILSIIIPFGYYLLGREKSRRRYKRAIGSNVFFFFGAFVVASIMLLGGPDVQAAESVASDSGLATGLGYLAAAILLSLLKGKKGNIARELVVIIAVGMPLIYLIGTPWMMAVTGIGWKAALLTGVVPFLPGDVAKCVGAVLICRPLKKALWNKK